ncbi:hypothetical protein BTE48_16440 [Oceanospirillum multiglobuliferum]|uniref:Uncharacterized protein n=1 Tax=Oceanospirillum multiglobuliferum TaxID=64969 RepID=A0A1V4T1J2_9GAMM|nr:hypothetical protein BTE48_16440 [Oceanospirillum multiglobuliferum]
MFGFTTNEKAEQKVNKKTGTQEVGLFLRGRTAAAWGDKKVVSAFGYSSLISRLLTLHLALCFLFNKTVGYINSVPLSLKTTHT